MGEEPQEDAGHALGTFARSKLRLAESPDSTFKGDSHAGLTPWPWNVRLCACE